MARTDPAGEAPRIEPWTEVRVEVPVGWQELVAEVLARAVDGAAAIGTPTVGTRPPADGCELVRVWLPESRDDEAARAGLADALARLARETGAPELDGLAPAFRVLPPEDWATSWRKAWKPFRVGRLCVLPPWAPDAPRDTDRVLVLRPGPVFGSGRHATTRTCLRALQALPLRGAAVVDAGTGSGILAVAAVLCGAASALGFDVDSNSAPEARRLARANGVAERCRFETGGFEHLPRDGSADVLFANVYHDVLTAEAPRIAAALRTGGRFLLSGIRADRGAAVAAALEGAGLEVAASRVRGRWATLLGARQRSADSA